MSKRDPISRISRRHFIATGATAGVGATALAVGAQTGKAADVPRWHRTADVVVVGSGASGLPAAIRARDLGASVIVVEENSDVGGHGMISQGNVSLGGGTPLQKKFGIEDSPDRVYLENTRPEHVHTRYADRAVVRAFADHNVAAYEFLLENGVVFVDARPTTVPAEGAVTPRRQTARIWSNDLRETINGTAGSGIMRPLEKSARAKGVEILLQHRMTRIVRQSPISGPVLGIAVKNLKEDSPVNIRARRGVIACTGGSSSNLFIRTIYDPRLTEEYQVGCEPYSRQSGDAEQQGMAIGASLGATSNMRSESYLQLTKPSFIGCRYGYARWTPGSPFFEKAGASGISVADYQDVICVDMLGRRFYDETVSTHLFSTEGRPDPVFGYLAAALASAVIEVNGVNQRAGGPIWAIFDADAVAREKWDPNPPFVDTANGYFFRADTLGELAGGLTANKYQKVPMVPGILRATVDRYNTFVDAGMDPDYGKPAPRYKVQRPPFYAAWATPILHDTYAGLRVNDRFQVMDIAGNVIPGLYCAGESAGGFALHGLGRCIVGGYIAATNAAREPVRK
ncbi:MAG: FAD-binding dehydrogenase [Acidobacteria bacterium]|nr:MAG: FAD-binding dehydrogenase [Acidobacteriota bacterium]PYR51082.1 MAG: FAD-binding dehydrogenase [Acidobacteriota bacterium]